MHPADVPRQQSTSGAEDAPPRSEDDQLQGALLGLLLELHPAPLTLAELILELASDPDDFMQRDDVERAARDLVGAGLLHRYPTRQAQTVFFFPTRAAARFAALELP